MDWNRDDPLARCEGERSRPWLVLQEYASMGAARSMRVLAREYERRKNSGSVVPTTNFKRLSAWSSQYAWQVRVQRWDDINREKAQEEYEARRRELMEKGLSQTHERLARLNEIFDRLYEDFQNDDNVWLPDVKGIGKGDNFERIDLVRFNAGLISELRSTLDDIAAEVGGRVKRTELTGANGGPIKTQTDEKPDLSAFDDTELEQWEHLLQKASGNASAVAPGSTG